MGVAVVRGSSRTRAGSLYRLPVAPIRAVRRGGPADPRARLVPAAPWWPHRQRKTFWTRMHDDRELIPLKTLLLTSLVLLAAVLEWVA